ncbi:NAD(P)-binding protein [Hortaea werneckii]|uniref:NAD(P)-binding protein n=2 Tax=Hortaea werneckii TaxID=91943 RepID=A0A3M7J3E5_HORWE|nr:NAD(P)-binding protein [Hortaea werneckii]OTA24307.1 hypothetical protein BTJ68_11803 [Hortaea werneckii EXF-2000]KAI6851492.1 NAD(P)-binding protein [Hortaea werneckii]KAI6939303.1 NAD(P)-binding protein [Hortaea werneckii]KAI6949184.1 NAD(P)-binding protein [Hortaea werneckii]
MSAQTSQFDTGHIPPVQQQQVPGWQKDMEQQPSTEYVPTPEGGYKLYEASGKLKNRKALITGGDSGIGKATAVLFAMEGADVLIQYLPEEEKDAQDTKAKVEKYGRKCYMYAANLKDKESCVKMVEKAVNEMGGINILFNNHAYQMYRENILEVPDEQWLHTFDTNIHPFFYTSKAALPHMKKGDTIINDASVNAYIGRPDLIDYTSTKGAIVAFTRALSNQWVAKGIRVNAIAPGPVYTPLAVATFPPHALEQFQGPMGRPGQPSEIGAVCVFLASTDSSQISGQTIHCNGGVVVNG